MFMEKEIWTVGFKYSWKKMEANLKGNLVLKYIPKMKTSSFVVMHDAYVHAHSHKSIRNMYNKLAF